MLYGAALAPRDLGCKTQANWLPWHCARAGKGMDSFKPDLHMEKY